MTPFPKLPSAVFAIAALAILAPLGVAPAQPVTPTNRSLESQPLRKRLIPGAREYCEIFKFIHRAWWSSQKLSGCESGESCNLSVLYLKILGPHSPHSGNTSPKACSPDRQWAERNTNLSQEKMTNPQHLIGTCRLCQKKESELRDSHIVPSFHKRNLVKQARDRGGVIVMKNGTKAIDRHRTGRSEYLLCGTCEGHINKWETYAANWFYNPLLLPTIDVEAECGTVYSGIQYDKFRLYCLSVLWRMAESSLPHYEKVLLPLSDAETIRAALNVKDTLDASFPVCFTRIIRQDGTLYPLTMQPFQIANEGRNSFHLVTNGFVHDFWTSGYERFPDVVECSLKRDGRLGIPSILYSDYAPFQNVVRFASSQQNNG